MGFCPAVWFDTGIYYHSLRHIYPARDLTNDLFFNIFRSLPGQSLELVLHSGSCDGSLQSLSLSSVIGDFYRDLRAFLHSLERSFVKEEPSFKVQTR